jgi:glycosyltransferase involved in cell wall biosynthesis
MYNISIILPCYNSQTYLFDCLESINNQNFEGLIELICIDDGSEDDTFKIINDFNFRDKISLSLISRENKGFLKTIIEGVKNTTYEYIARIDSDDIWEPNHLETLTKKIKEDESLVLIGSTALLIDDSGEEIGLSKKIRNPKIYLMNDNPFIHSSVIFKKSAYLMTTSGYNNNYELSNHFADYNLFLNLGKIGNLYIHTNYPTVRYRVLAESMSRNFNIIKNYKERYLIMKSAKQVNSLLLFYTIGLFYRVKILIKIYIKSW